MAQTGISIGTDVLPSLFQILGINNGQPASVDPSLDGAPGASDLQDTPAPQAKSGVPTKLGRLTQILQASQGNVDHPLMTDEHSSPSAPDTTGAPPARSLDQIMAGPSASDAQFVAASQGMSPDSIPDAGPIVQRGQLPDVGTTAPSVALHQTWAQQHPTLARILKGAAITAEGGAAGTGAMTFGEGFQRAHELTDPIRKQLEDATLAEKRAATVHTIANTEQMKSMVTLPNGLQVPFALAQRLYPTLLTEGGKDARQQKSLDSKEAIALRNKGMKLDDNGKQVPIPYEELTPTEQGHIDLQKAQQDYAKARTDYEKSKNDPNSAAYQNALGRLQVSRQNAQTALGRLGLSQLKYKGDYLGVGADGIALPSAPVDDNGNPIGLKTAQIIKPTNATRSKAEQAGIIKQQGEDILRQIDANPDIYGVVAGRWNDYNAGKFGNASQEVRDAYTSLKSFAALQPALHGARGIGMMKEFEDAVGGMGNNPEGLKGSIQSLLRTSSAFQKAGTMKTAPPKAAPQIQPPPGASDEVYAADGKTLIGHVVNGKYVAGK